MGFGLVVLLMWAGSASAEINVGESLEWMVADADVVVRAQVIEHGSVKGGEVVTFKVIETIKGSVGGKVEAVSRGYGSDKHVAAWKASGVELLVMLNTDKGIAWTHAVRASHGDVWAIELDGAPKHGAFSMDFEELKDKGRILALARACAAIKGPRPKLVHVDVPFSSPVFQKLYGGSAVWLKVPLDDRIAKRARGWAGAKAGHTKLEAIKVLAHFKTAEHVALLKGMLGDKTVWNVSDSKGSGARYLVREAAYEALSKWGVKVVRPKTRP